MEYFLDSDVARLVLGYLKEKSYHKTFQCFLKECCHLQEIYNLVKAGRQPRQISQLNLIVILEEWGKSKFQNDDADESEQNAVSPTSSSSFDDRDETLVSDNDVTRKKGTKRSPKRNKKITLVSKKIKSPTLKSPKSCNVSVLSPRKLRSGKSVRKDGTYTVDGTDHDSPARSSIKSPARTRETPEKSSAAKSPAANLAVAKKNNFPSEHRQIPSDISFNRSPAKHVKFSGTNKSSEVRNGAKCDEVVNSVQDTRQDEYVSKNKETVSKSGGVDLESVTANDGNRLSKSLHRSSQDLTVNNDRNNSDGANAAITSETYAKSDAVPPSESVGIADKCISWINGNVRDETPDRDHATVGSNGASSEYSSSESNVKACDTGDKEVSKHGHDIIPISHEPVIPILKTPKKMPPSLFKSSGELVTPVKLLLMSGEHISRSPRRKKPKTPRKRNSEVSPVSVVSAISVDPMFEKILSDHRLHQKLAETCNSIVQNQIKTNSGREKKETSATERVSPAPTVVSIDQETLAASKSLEEILEIDNNSHLEFLSDNFDMSDPAYESLFKLFGTDRETFSGYLRREKEKELAQMEAEVEELERSNHEILCANFGMSHADTSYETDEIGVNSPHHHHPISSQDLFSSQPSASSLTQIPGHVTSTPCIEGVPVSFTPLLRSHELGSSPVRSSSGMFGGAVSDKRTSPGSTATQPFSPAFSHHSDFNPPTPKHHQRLSKYINDPRSPRHCSEALYSNPATPQQPSSPHGSHLVHSTPTGSDSVRSQHNYDHFCQSSPIHPTCTAVSSGKLPPPCSPLVKGDLHSGSPRMVQRSACLTQENNSFPASAGASSELYFSSQPKMNSSNVYTSSNNNHLSSVVTPCFMNLLNDDENHTLTPTEPCSTIDNSIGCLSLPPSSGSQQYVSPDGAKSEVKRGKTRGKERKKQKGNTFSTLKGLLSKPLRHRNTVPLGLTAGELHEALKNSEKRGEHNLTFHSPNGKSTFKVPILDCQNDMGVLGMSGTDSEADHTISVYNESLDTSAQYSIAPENQATQALVNAIKAGNSFDVLQKMQSKKLVSSKKKSKSEKKLKKMKDKNKKNESDKNVESEISGSTPIVPHNDLDPNQDVYTATPVTALSKATTVRALNFGPNADDQAVGSYRTIFPKMPVSLTPSVLILNTNQLITPTHKVVVNATPGAMNKGNLKASPSANSGGKDKIKILSKLKTKSSSVSHEIEDVAMDVPVETPEKFENMISVREITEDTVKSTKPHVSDKKKSRTSSCSMTSTDIGSVSEKVNIEEKNKDEGVVLDSQNEVDIGKNTPNVKSKEELEGVETSIRNEQADNESCSRRITRSKKKHEKSREKLKVKLPVHKSPKIKKHENDGGKACIPFYFKPKSNIESTEKNAPLSTSQKKKSDKNRTSSKKIFKSVPVIVLSESSEDDTLRKNLMGPSTPDKNDIKSRSDECVMNNDNEPSSKEVLLEKIGLTPKKNVTDIEKVLRSPNRANALDVLAEWQSSPLNSRKRSVTPNTRNRFSRAEIENSPMKSPSTPKRKTPAKKLFTSPCKEQSSVQTKKDHKPRSTAKRVSVIIDRLKRNNPDTRLPSPAKVLDKDPEFSDCADLDSEFIDNCEEMEKNCNTKAESGIQKNKRSGRDKKKKTSNRVKEKELLEESGVVDTEETIAETNNVDSEIKDADTSEPSAVAVFDKLSGNSEDILNEDDHSNSPMKKDDLDKDVVNEIDNENNPEANELDQAVASIVFDADSSSHTIITHADIHSPPDITEGHLEEATDVNDYVVDSNTNDNYSDSENFEIHARSVEIDAVDHGNAVNKVEESNSVEKCDVLSLQSEGISNYINAASSISRKERRRKHKHRHHKHRRQHNDDLGDMPVGDLFVSPEELNEHKHRHHHKKKKKKSHKRRREEDEDGHSSKRHKKDKPSVSLDSLAALDVEEALSQIYSREKSV